MLIYLKYISFYFAVLTLASSSFIFSGMGTGNGVLFFLSWLAYCGILIFILSYLTGAHNLKYWAKAKTLAGSIIILIGHLGTVSAIILISAMSTGGASGLILLPSMLWAVLFYLIGTICCLVTICTAKTTEENSSNVKENKKLVEENLPNVNEDTKLVDEYWENVLNAAKIITNNNKDIISMINLAKSNPDEYSKKAVEKYDGSLASWCILSGSSNFDHELDENSIPAAVFKTTLFGEGIQAHFDWREIYDPEEMFWSLNNLLAKQDLPIVDKAELDIIIDEVDSFEEDPDLISEYVVEKLKEKVNDRDKRILWLLEGGDSFGFYIVSPEAFNELSNKDLDKSHAFIEYFL